MDILLIGCGHMGGAMLAGWLRHDRMARVDVVDPHWGGTDDGRVRVHADAGALAPHDYDAVVLAVKPQMMEQACAALAPHLAAGVMVISIAAGVPMARLTSLLGDRPVVRAMPNTPGAIGQGITGYCDNGKLTQKQIDTSVFLLSALGETVAIGDEKLMDAVTAVSGSGPAYVFALAEAMAKAGETLGLAPDVAEKLARVTVSGAGGLIAAKEGEKTADLRRAVTSPGGTTAAALDVLGQNQVFNTLMEEAIKAACRRGQDLAKDTPRG